MSESFAKKTITSAAWTYLGYVLNKSSGAVMQILLTHLVVPAEMGIVTLAITTMSFLDAVRDMGVGLALIQRREDIEEAADTAFWINIIGNIFFWLVTVVGAPFVASFFNEPRLAQVLPVISLTFILTALGGIHDALLQRDMKFSKRIIPDLASSFTKAVITIILAFLLPDDQKAWALVFGQIIGRVFYVIVVWNVQPWRPRWRINRRIAGQLLNFGYKISIDSFISALQANLDYVFIGRFLGEAVLGVYGTAFRVPELVIINFSNVIAGVLFPAYASLDNRDNLKQAMLSTLRYIAIVTVPAGIGMALVAQLFVKTLLAPDYIDAGPMMALLALYGMFLAVSWNIGDVYKAIARPDILWKTSLLELVLLGTVLYFMAHISAIAVSFGHVCVAFVVSTVRLFIAIRLLELPVSKTFAQFIPSVVGSAIMGVAVWLSLQATAGLPGVISLVLSIAVGGLVYIAALYWLERDMVLRVAGQLRERFLPERASAS
ncbi:MAG: lipopolysaccharide biosynthesis protein [Anaerolineae bacterium]